MKREPMKNTYLCGLSMLTPLGASPEMVAAAMNAGINSYQECDLLGDDEPTIKFSPVPPKALNVRIPNQLPGMSPPQIRLLKLATFALADIASQLPSEPIPLFLAGPEPYYPQIGITQTFIKHLVNSTGVNLDFNNSRYIATGRSGVIEAIDTAFTFFTESGAHYALVGGIDSFYDLRTIGILSEKRRIAGDDSFDGFVPSEAASFLLIASANAPESVRDNSLLRLYQPAMTYESGHLLSDAPYTAEALAHAVRAATGKINAPIDTVYASENGEMHYTKELTLARLRNQHALDTNVSVVRPAEHFGDIGAAFAAVAIGLATVKPQATTLICASSDGGSRGAICVSAN